MHVLLYVQYLADIEEHLGVTIDTVDTSIKVPVNDFDGKVVYGQKTRQTGEGSYNSCIDRTSILQHSILSIFDFIKFITTLLNLHFPVVFILKYHF